jgi:hypothetical protein
MEAIVVKLSAGSRLGQADRLALLTMYAVIVAFMGARFYYDNWLSDHDLLTFFLQNFSFVGDRLGDLELPAWNPHDASGAPGIGNPSNGWMHLVVMVCFAIFDATLAIKVMALIQTIIAGTATYAFGRVIGFHPMPALLAALSFAGINTLYASTSYVTVVGLIFPYIAVGVLAAEMSLRSRSIPQQTAWSVLAGFAIVQIFAGWPGQGVVFASAYILGWYAYRALFAPLASFGTRRQQLDRFIYCGSVVGATFLLFGAAVILPVLSVIDQSSIAGGDYDNVMGGDYSRGFDSWSKTFSIMLQYYGYWRFNTVTATVALLAVAAIIFGRNCYGVPFFALLAFIYIDINANFSFTRWFVYLIPGVEHLHDHRAEATLWLVPFALSMLGGAGLQLLRTTNISQSWVMKRQIPLICLLSVIIYLWTGRYPVGRSVLVIALLSAGLIVLFEMVHSTRWPEWRSRVSTWASAGLIALVMIFPNGTDIVQTLRNPDFIQQYEDLLGTTPEIEASVDQIMSRTEPTGIVPYLQKQSQIRQPFRIAPFHGLNREVHGNLNSSEARLDEHVIAILANARPTRLGLQQISGYNPVHLKYYQEYVKFMNHEDQDYHWLDLTSPALRSQLLNMLNVRYVLVPSWSWMGNLITTFGEPVYSDDLVTVFENPNAFPRAWLVHDVRDNQSNAYGLFQLQQNQVDGWQVGFVNGTIPSVAPPTDGGATDRVVVTDYDYESITFRSSSTADSLMVISEVYTTGWKAYVDGKQVDVIRTNHALRGVPVAAGTHTIEMRYEPSEITLGLWTTGIAGIAMVSIWIWAGIDRRARKPRRKLGRQPRQSPAMIPQSASHNVTSAGSQSKSGIGPILRSGSRVARSIRESMGTVRLRRSEYETRSRQCDVTLFFVGDFELNPARNRFTSGPISAPSLGKRFKHFCWELKSRVVPHDQRPIAIELT